MMIKPFSIEKKKTKHNKYDVFHCKRLTPAVKKHNGAKSSSENKTKILDNRPLSSHVHTTLRSNTKDSAIFWLSYIVGKNSRITFLKMVNFVFCLFNVLVFKVLM